jgi:hypothetical protein
MKNGFYKAFIKSRGKIEKSYVIDSCCTGESNPQLKGQNTRHFYINVLGKQLLYCCTLLSLEGCYGCLSVSVSACYMSTTCTMAVLSRFRFPPARCQKYSLHQGICNRHFQFSCVHVTAAHICDLNGLSVSDERSNCLRGQTD